MADLDTTPRALRPPRSMEDVHIDALHLAGLLYLVRYADAHDTKSRGAVDAGLRAALDLAEIVADDMEAIMRAPSRKPVAASAPLGHHDEATAT